MLFDLCYALEFDFGWPRSTEFVGWRLSQMVVESETWE